MCDIVHALLLERVEGDARAQFVAAGAAGADGMEEYAPELARGRLEELLTATESSRRAGISDEEWELRVALGVGVSGGR